MIPTNLKDAKSQNEKYYFTGKPCKSGHIAKRATHNGVCLECNRISQKDWFDRNNLDLEWRKRKAFRGLMNRANRENIPFNLEFNDIDWPDVCPVFGCELDYTATGAPKFNSVSFDKIKPELGYVKGNVKVISYRANWLKQDSTIQQLESILAYMKENQD